jgi:hypothetical protein
MHRFFRVIQVALLIAVCGFGVGARSAEKGTVLQACSDLFGASIDANEDLFEVNSIFVLQPKFDSAGNLIRLSVFPKYWLEEKHPEWTEPEKWPLFSPNEYEELVTRLNTLVPKGALLEASKGSFVTNSTAYLLDKYEYAYLLRGSVADLGVRFVDLYPFHELKGSVKKKQHLKSVFSDDHRILVGELNYFVRPADYRSIKLRRPQRLRVVGPIKGYCFGGHCNH